MKLVIDSSVALKWFVDEPGRDAAVALDENGVFFAPDLLLAEVTNALWRKVRAGEVSALQVERAIEEIEALISLRPITAEMSGVAFRIAQELEHSVYDCLFLACAEAEGASLVTVDETFLAKIEAKGRVSSIRHLT